jgi:DNA-binding NtrC family response regulator
MDIQSIKSRFGIIGNSAALNHALNTAVQVAGTDLSVLIVGESGVGKEVFSNIIHSLSSRKHNPFIAVNCGAIPEGTIDSELFGHEKGSFTGAVDSRKGYFETVSGGTIFLDEIGEMPLGTQARLLRVLETGEFIRVGSSKVQRTNVRVIAATNRDLLEFTHEGKFRQDLYYRLSTVPIRVPALRDRKEDIALLFRKFAADFSEKYKTPPVQLDSAAQGLLVNHPWRGNVRELKNIAEQISVLSPEKTITLEAMAKFLPTKESSSSRNMALMAPASMQGGGNSDFSTERDILYKLIFDLKKDMKDLKNMIFDVAQHQGYNPDESGVVVTSQPSNLVHVYNADKEQVNNTAANYPAAPILIESNDNHQDVEETLLLTDREKELITLALKKHKSRRRDAASELGISERTLYRKIKEYDIKD